MADSSAPPWLSVIIPALNEERRLPATLAKLREYLEKQAFSHDVWVVDNGSTDRTPDLVREQARGWPCLRLIRNPVRGKGSAVRAGMLQAGGKYRFLCDADLSMPVEEFERFYPPRLSDADVAIGSREAAGARRFHEPEYRHLTGRVFSLAVKLLVMRGFEDTQCGFKCFRDSAAEDLFSRQRFNGWSFDVEVLYLARRRGMRICEVPISWYYQSDSRIRLFSDSLRMFLDLIRIRWYDLRGIYANPDPHSRPDS
ncbi:MAG: glycosyltransferase family 2 protein [Anaerolineales bacterium]|nr:glycosyltransferase family 2 protein [Anaerolineales bacterium]